MRRGAAAFLHEAARRLHVEMMHAATANPQPFAPAPAHEMQGRVRVLERGVGLHRFQIGPAKNKSGLPQSSDANLLSGLRPCASFVCRRPCVFSGTT